MVPVIFYMLLHLFSITVETLIDSNAIEARKITRAKTINYYWNVPTFQCDSYKINFTGLAEKFGIIQNSNDRFRGNEIVILYDPGSFPALLKAGSKLVRRNGGVPQEGNLTLHITLFEEIVEQLVAEDFAGVGIIDFESWRPIFRQNFGTLRPYKELSIEIEQQTHPFWPKALVQKEAVRRFESHARKFMEETLYVAKKLRGNATWGYYAYPYCYNMSPNNLKTGCPNEVQKENDKTDWLFRLSDNLYPSLYFDMRLTAKQKVQMIEGRISEARRIARNIRNKTRTTPKVIPYFWYKYYGGQVFLTKEDIFNTFTTLSTSDVDGVIIWGSSNDVNTKRRGKRPKTSDKNPLGQTREEQTAVLCTDRSITQKTYYT